MNEKLNCVLLVDDDLITNKINKYVIEKANLSKQVRVAENGEVALNCFRNGSVCEDQIPDLVFLDINMPKMNGWEFLNEYKNLKRDKKSIVIMLSASINPDDRKRAESIDSVAEFLEKPLDELKIERIVKNYFNK